MFEVMTVPLMVCFVFMSMAPVRSTEGEGFYHAVGLKIPEGKGNIHLSPSISCCADRYVEPKGIMS